MKKSSFCKKLTLAKNTVIFTAQAAVAICLSLPVVLAFAVFMGGGNIKDTRYPA